MWRVKADETAGYLGSPWSRRLASTFDDRPASEYFSPEFCRRVLRPMSVRMNGAEPNEIYVGNLASNVRMILDTYEQFQHGLAPLLQDVQRHYDVRVGTAAEALLFTNGRVSGVRVRSADGRTADLHGSGVILATPAHAAAALTESVLPGLAASLRAVAYYPVTLAVAEYDRPVFTSSVRAFVFGDEEVVSNAGAYGINDLNVVRYTFSGRTARSVITDTAEAESVLQAGEAALAKYVPLDPAWRRRSVVRHFRPGLCAYTPHHGRFLDRIATQLADVRGLFLTGDYMQGASIEACFRAAAASVSRLALEAEHAAADEVPMLELQPQR